MNQPEIVVEGAKGSPGWVVALIALFQQWDSASVISALTIVYLLLQICWLLWKWRKAAQNGEVQE